MQYLRKTGPYFLTIHKPLIFIHMVGQVDYQYDTRCKRCDKVHTWHSTIDGWDAFVSYCTEHTQYPFYCQCERCEKRTFQDIVSYGMVERNSIRIFPKLPVLELPERFNWLKPMEIIVFNDARAFRIGSIDVSGRTISGVLFAPGSNGWVEIIYTFTEVVEKLISGEAWRSWIGPKSGQDDPILRDSESWIYYGQMLPNSPAYYETKDSANIWRRLFWNGAVWYRAATNGHVFSGFVSYWRICMVDKVDMNFL